MEYDKWGLSFPLNGYILDITREGNTIPKWLCASVYVMGCAYYTVTRHGDVTRDKRQSTWSTSQNTDITGGKALHNMSLGYGLGLMPCTIDH